MPEWMHNRAEHILARNPSMPKSEAFAIATQQSHSLGKSPKGYGTVEGKRTAKAKFDTPRDDKKTANPGHLESAKMDKQAGRVAEVLERIRPVPSPIKRIAAQHGLDKRELLGAVNRAKEKTEFKRMITDMGKVSSMQKQASGFTTEYDGDGQLVSRSTREQELDSIFSRDRSFGYGGELDQTKMSAMRRELLEIAKLSMSLDKITDIAHRAGELRGQVPSAPGKPGMGVLNQMTRSDLTVPRRRELARSAISALRKIPKVVP